MQQSIRDALHQIGDTTKLVTLRPVSGGTINEAYYVKTEAREYFLKLNDKVEKDFFQKEASGLQILKKADAIPVPHVYGVSNLENGTSVIILEWVEGEKTSQTEDELGRGVARLHQTVGDAFGLHEDNYIGLLPLENGWYDDWISFYREQRLRAQLRIGERLGCISGTRKKRLETLIERLDRWIPAQVTPSLIHGDLWSGNWITGPHGIPYLIDPVVCFAHAELELSFTEFGGFSPRFYQAYHEILPLDPGYQERKPLYELYYLLVHLNLFGEPYGVRTDRILDHYL